MIDDPRLSKLSPSPSSWTEDLRRLLERKNGFFAFESALHVQPGSVLQMVDEAPLR